MLNCFNVIVRRDATNHRSVRHHEQKALRIKSVFVRQKDRDLIYCDLLLDFLLELTFMLCVECITW